MNELNQDWVFWMGVATITVSCLVVVFFGGRKLFRAMDGQEKDS